LFRSLGGVIHCAAVLDDGMLIKQTPARFAAVMGPKADGAWRLHRAFERFGHRPDFFVLYSSLSAVFGSAGQGNYVAANAFLDALAWWRRDRGDSGTSVNWGAWSEVGMAARGTAASRARAQGLAPLSPTQGMQALGVLLRDDVTRASVAPVDWGVLASQFGGGSAPHLLRDLVAEAQSRTSIADGGRASERERRVDFEGLEL